MTAQAKLDACEEARSVEAEAAVAATTRMEQEVAALQVELADARAAAAAERAVASSERAALFSMGEALQKEAAVREATSEASHREALEAAARRGDA